MNRRYGLALTSVLYFICCISVLVMLANAASILHCTHSEKFIVGVIVVVSFYSACCFRCITQQDINKKKLICKRHMILLFLFYIIMLIDFTLIDDSFGRDIFNVFNWNRKAFYEYINQSTNIIPFATVKLFIRAYKSGSLPIYSIFENIIGNIIVFMPLPFFIHCIFKNAGKWYIVFLSVLLSVLTIEFLQFIFMTGSSDIDDVILNVSGSMLFYALLRCRKISKLVSKVTFGMWNIEK